MEDRRRKASNDGDHSGSQERAKVQRVEEGTHGEIIANHYNSIKEVGQRARVESNIYHMRNFNNWIKSQLIDKYMTMVKAKYNYGAPMCVLDMCCGKGGDLLKWREARIKKLVCTDIAELSIDQCRERYRQMDARRDPLFELESHVCDSTIDSQRAKYSDPTIKFNLVSCQFAFHYCFESLPQAERMLKNASECLTPGGYFIGTIPDAHEIMKRQKETPGEREFGNEVYKISFECDVSGERPPPLFGAKYNFYLDGVVNCPEFIVYFPMFVKLARKFGLKLVEKTGFHEFFYSQKDKGKYMLERVNALETFPPRGGPRNPKYDAEDNYAHARQVFEQDRNKYHPQVGTLSKCEWEATGLYTVFAFEKMKFTWSSDGHPIYESD